MTGSFEVLVAAGKLSNDSHGLVLAGLASVECLEFGKDTRTSRFK